MKMNKLLSLLMALMLAVMSIPAMAEGDPVVGSAFGGEVTVTLSEVKGSFETALAYYLDMYTQYGYAVDEYDVEFQSSIAQEAVEVELSEKIIDYYAAKNGYVLTPEKEEDLTAQMTAAIDSAREYYQSYLSYYGYTGEELDAIVEEELAAIGYNAETLYPQLLLNDKYGYLEALATEGVAVTEEEVKASFEAKVETAKQNYASSDAFINDYINEADILYTPEGMRCIQSIYIALETEEQPADENVLVGKAKADAVVEAIRGGADFVETMIANNEDSATAEQLTKGYPVAADSTTYGDDYKAAAMALEKIGDVSDVLVTEYGYFILRYAGDLQSGTVDFDSRKDIETEEALAAKKEAVFTAYLADVLAEAAIEVKDTTGLYHIYVSQSVEPTIAYASAAAETLLTDIPEGDAVAVLGEGASVYVLGSISMDGAQYTLVSVPGTEFKGFVSAQALVAIEEETALAVDNAALVKAGEALDKNPTFVIAMNDGGVIYGELYPQTAPQTVGNFVALANSGFYNGLIFHRVIPGFMIQGGDPMGSGIGGPGYAIKGEFSSNGVENPLSHTRGVISMARSAAKDSAGSQFFIMHADSDHLDGEYAAFGQVLGGIETVDLIASVVTDGNDKPRTEQAMREVFVQTYGKSYEFNKLED